MSGNSIDTPYQGTFFGKAHYFALRIYYEDTDAAGIVYYANYLRFMERARSDMLRAMDIDQRAALENGDGHFVVAEAAIKYHAPARLDDALVVVSEVKEVRAATCIIHQRVMRGDEKIVSADIVIAFIGIDGRPKRQPPSWAKAFKRLKGENEC